MEVFVQWVYVHPACILNPMLLCKMVRRTFLTRLAK